MESVKIAFVMPCVGKKKRVSYVKTWQMEPLAIAVLSSLTPPGHEKSFYDDRIEPPRYDERPDLVAINVETYTARRAYQIAAEYRSRGSKVVMGGFHATLIPEEVEMEADSVVVGGAEGTWPRVVADAEAGRLAKRYEAVTRTSFGEVLPDGQSTRSTGTCPLLSWRRDGAVVFTATSARFAASSGSATCPGR